MSLRGVSTTTPSVCATPGMGSESLVSQNPCAWFHRAQLGRGTAASRRDCVPEWLARFVRNGPPMSDNDHDDPTQPPTVTEILQLWVNLGEQLFADGTQITIPTLATVSTIAELFAIELALTLKKGNLTHATTALAVSRRSAREKLKGANRYPWSSHESLKFSVLDGISIPD